MSQLTNITTFTLTNFANTLHDFTKYIIKHNLIPTFDQYRTLISTSKATKSSFNIDQPYYYNLHSHNIININQNPTPEFYKIYLNKIKINNIKTPPNFHFIP